MKSLSKSSYLYQMGCLAIAKFITEISGFNKYFKYVKVIEFGDYAKMNIFNYNDIYKKEYKESFRHDFVIYVMLYIYDYKVFTGWFLYDDKAPDKYKFKEMENIYIEDGDNILAFLKPFFKNLSIETDIHNFYEVPNWFKKQVKLYYNDFLLELNGKKNRLTHDIIQKRINTEYFKHRVDEKEYEQVCFLLGKYLETLVRTTENMEISNNAKKRSLEILKKYILPSLGYTEDDILEDKLLDSLGDKKYLLELKKEEQ